MLLLAFILRLFLIYFQYSGDIGNHLAWADSFLDFGARNFFSRPIPGFNTPNYPTFTIYLFVLSRLFYETVLNLSYSLNQNLNLFPSLIVPLLETNNAQAAFMKLPAILADLGIGLLIYKFTKSKLWTALFLFNPATIYISSVWGQIESIPIFFLLLSLYFTNQKYKHSNLFSHLSFTLAILTKQTALWLLPVYLILWFKKGLREFSLGLLVQLILFVLLYLPFISSPLEPFSLYLSTLSGSSTLISDAAWNTWSFYYHPKTADSVLLGPLSVRNWSILSLLLSYLIALYLYFQKKLNVFSTLFFLSLAAFFLQTRVHERHLFPALVFALLLPLKSKSRLVVVLILSIYHMLNLYASLKLPFI